MNYFITPEMLSPFPPLLFKDGDFKGLAEFSKKTGVWIKRPRRGKLGYIVHLHSSYDSDAQFFLVEVHFNNSRPPNTSLLYAFDMITLRQIAFSCKTKPWCYANMCIHNNIVYIYSAGESNGGTISSFEIKNNEFIKIGATQSPHPHEYYDTKIIADQNCILLVRGRFFTSINPYTLEVIDSYDASHIELPRTTISFLKTKIDFYPYSAWCFEYSDSDWTDDSNHMTTRYIINHDGIGYNLSVKRKTNINLHFDNNIECSRVIENKNFQFPLEIKMKIPQ